MIDSEKPIHVDARIKQSESAPAENVEVMYVSGCNQEYLDCLRLEMSFQLKAGYWVNQHLAIYLYYEDEGSYGRWPVFWELFANPESSESEIKYARKKMIAIGKRFGIETRV